MQIHRVHLTNFRQHEESELELGPGITAVIGPTGSGKTTILEAIGWAFYGLGATRGNKDSIRRSAAPARSKVQVEVDFSLDGHEYRVVRGLHRSELYQDGASSPVVNGTREVDSRLRRILGMDRDEFFNTYFTGQKELKVMASLGGEGRRRFLSRVLGYEKLRVIQERLKDERGGINATIRGLEVGLRDEAELAQEYAEGEAQVSASRQKASDAAENLAAAARNLATAGPEWTRWVELKETLQSMLAERKLGEQRVEEARREFARLDRELAAALTAGNKLSEMEPELALVEPLKRELASLEEDARKAGTRRELLGQLEEVESETERISKRLAELDTVTSDLETARTELAAVNARLEQAEIEEEDQRTLWVRDRQEAETKRESLQVQYKDAAKDKKRLEELGPDGSCPMCSRQLGEEFGTVIKSLAAQMEEIEINGKFFKQRVKQLAEEPAALREAAERLQEITKEVEAANARLTRTENLLAERKDKKAERAERVKRAAKLREEIAELPDSYDDKRHDEVRDGLKKLEPTVSQAAELRVRAERAEALVLEAEQADKTLSVREEELESLSARIEELGFDEERFAASRERFQSAEEDVRRLELEKVQLEADARAAVVALDSVAQRMSERTRRAEGVAKYRTELRLNETLNVALKNLRNELNASMRPEISEYASSFLADLTDGRYQELELDEDYGTAIVEDGIPKQVISGGEEDVANLVLRIAISQMVAERSGHPLSLLVLDEIFGSLDDNLRESVIDLLRRLGDRFPQVVLISHIEAVRHGADRVIKVSIDERTGASILTEERGEPHVAA